ncbi:GNAT family N-acetyltransferase [Teredinibacter purpureus]|uniref:GNAT family N-acetyltransferase n=1 Tax=Teredinibacter purpureus TaxID=2731756 RepID=UPI0005F7ED91|nr:GNAT family N-acetyltransferase [Teredinibacter purpureus]
MGSEYHITVSSEPLEAIGKLWQALEPNTAQNVFLSWRWVSAWLETIAPDAMLVTLFSGEDIVGLGLFTIRVETRHRLIRSRVLRLGRTGCQQEDQIWPEYNGLLLHRAHQASAPSAFMAYLNTRDDWDEFELGATAEPLLKHYQNKACNPVEKWAAPAFGVDLRAVKATNKEYLAGISRNTRYQINRCKKSYSADGTISFRVLKTAEQINGIWPDMVTLHRKRWDHTPEKSGFSNPIFSEFHRQLVARALSDESVHICALYVDDRLLACSYNLLCDGVVYFYLSGVMQETDKNRKPGLLLHTFSIDYYAQAGFRYYDFMAGDAQYKRSMAEQHSMLKMVSFQRKKIRFKFERLARALKNKVH